MIIPAQAGTNAQLALLEAEAQALEARLAELHATIAALREQQACATSLAADAGIPHPQAAAPLQPLPTHDPLRDKWQLGSGFQSTAEGAAYEGGQLRLSGFMEDGQAWECLISFSDLARPGGLSLGRSSTEADIVLPDDGASRRHALLEITEAGLVITDLASTNGTYVNSHRLSPYERRVPLPHGATISLGATQLRLEYV